MPDTHKRVHAVQRVVRSASGYKGVSWHRKRQLWRAYIGTPSKHIGYFRDARDAAQAYDDAAKEMYGETAWLNFPLNGEQQNVKLEHLEAAGRPETCIWGHVNQWDRHGNCIECFRTARERVRVLQNRVNELEEALRNKS